MKNIRLSTGFNLEDFKTLFPEIEVYDPIKDEDLEIDLMVFPGGEDVSLEYYLPNESVKQFKPLCHTNPLRDEYESEILLQILSDKLKVKKILGICRGAQFLNVKFGGTLFADLNHYNLSHSGIHELYHVNKSNLSFITVVNSLHHQGIWDEGTYYRPLNLGTNPKVIAMEKNSRTVVEIISWLDEKVLAFQFHPEYYDEHEYKIQIRDFLNDWVDGKRTVFAKKG